MTWWSTNRDAMAIRTQFLQLQYGWDGTRAGISDHASNDTQSAHDERGDWRFIGEGGISLALSIKLSLGASQVCETHHFTIC
jgi:hypothetical protein